MESAFSMVISGGTGTGFKAFEARSWSIILEIVFLQWSLQMLIVDTSPAPSEINVPPPDNEFCKPLMLVMSEQQ